VEQSHEQGVHQGVQDESIALQDEGHHEGHGDVEQPKELRPEVGGIGGGPIRQDNGIDLRMGVRGAQIIGASVLEGIDPDAGMPAGFFAIPLRLREIVDNGFLVRRLALAHLVQRFDQTGQETSFMFRHLRGFVGLGTSLYLGC